ncbi:hypothetical protein SKAU_G00255610 [Synaphobranchus kaupii]|uniref:Cilia- and flagella-associated protein 57 n=1 Tax=Synaphobranchus kaupii TaxID=118154 RepID=A0A9Q1F3T3_SYNKA|nr:hypothetical protein SKAU_G00255610 [Synaphobranchus kaupii]
MSAADAEPHFVFGVQTGVANSLIYLDEQNILFPFGNNCVCFNIERKCQDFIQATQNSLGMLALAISANRRYLAVSERGEQGTITVYDLLEKNRKKHVLSLEDGPVQEFVSVAFSHDCHYLISQSGAPDWTLFFWTLRKPRVIVKVKTGGLSYPINQVSFSPEDNTRICVCGNGLFKLLHHTAGELKQCSIKKLENMESHNFLSHSWVSERHVIVGTDAGRLMGFESGVLCWETNVMTAPLMPDSERSEETNQEEGVAAQQPCITAIVAYSRGFICSAGPGMVCLFDRMNDGASFRKSREIRIPPDTCCHDPSQAEKQEIVAMCISPTEAILSASTDRGQLYCANLIAIETSKEEEEPAQFEYLYHAFHWGTITSLSICVHKPLIATSSLDLSVRIWNFKTNTLEIYKGFSEEPHCVALHPSGLSVMVAFNKRLAWMNLLFDNFRLFKEFTLKGCTECAFSNGGHMFAAISGTTVHIYSTASFENIMGLADHNATVRSIVWSEDDSKLVSCGTDGVVYCWDAQSGELESECTHKSCRYTNVSISPDGETIFAVGTDCTLKEIQDGQILTEVPANTVTYTTLALSREGKVLFCGTSAGSITIMSCPLSSQEELFEFKGHAGAITRMAITFDDQFLLTISEDGSLLIWKIIWNRYGLMRDKKMCYLEEILITKSDLEEKNYNMMELNARVQVLNIENQYQLRLKDMEHKRLFKKMTAEFTQQIEALEQNMNVLKAEKDKLVLEHNKLLKEVVEEHARVTKELNSSMQRKLGQEYKASHVLQLGSQKELQECRLQLQSMEDSHKRVLEQLTGSYESKLQENLLQLQQCKDGSRQQRMEYELMIKMIEQDGDREILDIRCKYETKLKEEREISTQYKDEAGIMRKKFNCLQKEISDKNKEIEKLKAEVKKHLNVISCLENDILGLEREIMWRNENIEEKEVQIGQMRKRNVDLEKLKYILDHRVHELTTQIEPKEKTIKEMKEQIQQMEGELAVFSKQNAQLEISIAELKLKLKATDKDMRQAMEKACDMRTIVKGFKADLLRCADSVQDPRNLKESVLELHDRYIDQDEEDGLRQDLGKLRDGRNRDDVGKTVVMSLRRKLAKETETHCNEKFKWMQDDSTLIKELNDLRKELKLSQDKVHDYENQLSVYRRTKSSTSFGTEECNPSACGPGIQATTLTPEEENQRIIRLQRAEIHSLRQQILEYTGEPH